MGGGGVLPGRMVLLRLAPSFDRGTGLACAVVPPAPPSDVFRNRGTPPVPPAGAAPPAPRAASVASLRWRIGTLPSLPPGTGTGTVFDCMLVKFFSRISGVSGTEPSFTRRLPVVSHRWMPSLSRRGSVVSRRASVADPSLSRMVPRSLCPTTAVGRVPTFLGWMRAWGRFPDPPAQGGSLWIPPVHLYAAGFMGLL